uniref:Apple domain-containing protein n=1 Tax=Solanum tuberosum TaxID=4113 RepID=M1DN08_SOLTU
MGRAEWWASNWCYYKRSTILVCSINIFVALYVLHSYTSPTINDAVESWRRKKLKEARELVNRKTSNSTIAPEEAGLLAQILDVDWAELSEEIGLWIPVAIINNEHHDKPEGEEEFDNEIIAGRRLPPECNIELHTDYGGDAVRWGLTHPKESAFECCMACLNQAKNAGPNDKKCNIWVYCPFENGCYSPDIYQHKNQECWLKYAEKAKSTFKDQYSESFRNAHPNAPVVVPWMSGVVSV